MSTPPQSDRPTPRPGGIIHTYMNYDPVRFPGPQQPPADVVSPAFEHWLEYGNLDDLTEEQLANAIEIDPEMILGLGPSLQSLIAMLEARKRRLLETFDPRPAQKQAHKDFQKQAKAAKPPEKIQKRYEQAIQREQVYELENLYYLAGGDQTPFARSLLKTVQKLTEKYEVEQLLSKYEFTGTQPVSIPEAIKLKEELTTIDELLEQLRQAQKNARVGIVNLEDLSRFAQESDIEQLRQFQQQVEDYIRQQAAQQGLEGDSRRGFQMTPKALRLFQSKILTQIFNELQASRTGRHPDPVEGDGATESARTKDYEFGDSIAHLDLVSTFTNALIREPGRRPIRLAAEDLVIHRTRNTPKAATCVLLDMSGSMRYDGMYVNVKRMGLALDGLIRSQYPGDFLQFIEMFTFAKPRPLSEVPALMPKPVTIYNPVVRLSVDMSDPKRTEYDVPWHFTNIQHALQTARRYLANQPTPNRNIMLITDGLPTAHFEDSMLYLLYPPHPRTEQATLREAMLCAQEGITINIFLLSSWNQSREDIQFAYRMAESTRGRVIFTTGKELDRFVIWDYIKRRKTILG